MDVIEFTDAEGDEEDRKENDDNFRINLASNQIMSALLEQHLPSCEDDLLNQYSDITTPPPKKNASLS